LKSRSDDDLLRALKVNGYFDFNATTPMFPEAISALTRACERRWQNPSSLYLEAGETSQLLEDARSQLADLLGVDEPERIIFTSGATESNNIVFRHHAEDKAVISAIEHPSVREPAGDSTIAPVDDQGRVDLESLANLISKDRPKLVSIMAANNETGVIQPWSEARALAEDASARFHCDAVQLIGKGEIDDLGECDWVTGSAHKFGGPKGVGFLVLPEDLEKITGASIGGPQESGLRAGTENYPGIASMLAALERAQQLLAGSVAIGTARDDFEGRIVEKIPGSKVCGRNAERLWNTSMLVLPTHRNTKWLNRLSRRDFQVSTGSACSSGKGNPSHVMQAMGLDFDEMGRVLRISGGWETTETAWQALGDALIEIHEELNKKARPSA
jgi:cysteine desulfurase